MLGVTVGEGRVDLGTRMLGVTVGEGRVDSGWVNVRWDHGDGNSYRVGANGKYDLMVVPDGTRTGSPRVFFSNLSEVWAQKMDIW